MTRSIETRSPEFTLDNGLHAEFGDIVDTLRREEPELFDDVDLVLHLNAELARNDLPQDRLEYLEDERRGIVEEFLARPEDSLLAEVDMLARRYDGRALTDVDSLGVRTTQFVTRDPERKSADLHFKVLEFPSGRSRINIEVPLRDELFPDVDEPFYIELDSESGLTIEQRFYQRGQYRYQTLTPDSEKGRDRLWRFFTHSFIATDLLDHRSGPELISADQQAKRMLYAKLAGR